MSFVQFTGAHSRRTGYYGLVGVTLNDDTWQVFFLKGLRERYGIGQYQSVELYWDEGERVLALRLSNEPEAPGIRPLSRYLAFYSTAFVQKAKEFGYPMKTPLLVQQIKDGLLVIQKEAA